MDPLERLNALGQFRMKMGLGRIRRLMNELGSPQVQVPSVHIAGTNGKGSTCHMVDSILSSFPLKRALYTSPHLIDISERITFNGSHIEKDVLRNGLERIFFSSDPLFKEDDLPTYFEVLTALFFKMSQEMGSDINIVEVGMGGRFDATNILQPLAIGITSISLDHQDYLGDEVHQIAREKAGIIKPSTPVVIGPLHDGGPGGLRALINILDICTENGSPVIIVARAEDTDDLRSLMTTRAIPDGRIVKLSNIDPTISGVSTSLDVERLYNDGSYEDLLGILDNVIDGRFKTPLLGTVQAYNMAISICLSLLCLPMTHSNERIRQGHTEAVEDMMNSCSDHFLQAFPPEELRKKIKDGLSKTYLPGRLDLLKTDGLNILFDGGHNSEAAFHLGRTISEMYPGKRFPLLIAMMKGKDPSSYAKGVSGVVSSVIVTEIEDKRAIPADEVACQMADGLEPGTDIHIRKGLDKAFDLWLQLAKEDNICLAGGSFYLYAPLNKRIRTPI